jgi:hypothetical protein
MIAIVALLRRTCRHPPGRLSRASGTATVVRWTGASPRGLGYDRVTAVRSEPASDPLAAAGLTDPDAEHDPAELARLLDEVVPRGQEQNAFEAMARLPHREVAEVLTVIGRHHPDKKTAKPARKAAYKAGTRRAQSTV